jgi:hypothetical protein
VPTIEVEIARRDEGEFRSVRLELQADGALRLHAYDMSAPSPAADGREQYELWVTVPAAEVPKLAFLLLKERYAGRLQGVTEFRDFCKANEVVNEFGTLG